MSSQDEIAEILAQQANENRHYDDDIHDAIMSRLWDFYDDNTISNEITNYGGGNPFEMSIVNIDVNEDARQPRRVQATIRFVSDGPNWVTRIHAEITGVLQWNNGKVRLYSFEVESVYLPDYDLDEAI